MVTRMPAASRGAIGDVPVRNVSMMVLDAGYTVFELQPRER
jgi:hypothetical protein